MPALFDGPSDARHHLILAHGAGEGPASPFLSHIARGLAEGGVGVTRFAFPTMGNIVRSGRRRPPDREPVLRAAWHQAIAAILARGLDPSRLFIGGKSMGGRIASLIADEVGAAGLICLGYPFHPPGDPKRLRTAHLAALRTPTLICQGTRDPFGRPEEVAAYPLSPAARMLWVPDGEHSFKPTKASGRTWEANLDLAAGEVLAFVRALGPCSQPPGKGTESA